MATVTSDRGVRVMGALVFLAAVGVGVGIGAVGGDVAVLVPLVLGGIVVLFRPMLGLLGMAFVIPFENMLLFAGANSATKLLAAFVAGAWFLAKLIQRESWRRILGSRVTWALGAFMAFAYASVPWSELPQPGLPPELYRMVMFLGLGFLTMDLVRTWDETRWLTRLLVLGGLIGASLTLSQYVMGGVRRAGEGISGGINATALVLLTIVPFAFALIRGEDRAAWKLVGVSYVALGVAAMAVTFSRMTFLVLPLLLAAELWETFRTPAGRKHVLALMGAGAVVFFSLVPMQELVERAETIGPYIQETLSGTENSVVDRSGRGYHILIAFSIFREHPFVGAGYGNYGQLFLRYQHEVPGAGMLYETPRSPHGNYWGYLADLGLAGTGLWMLLLLFAFLNLRGAWKRLSRDRSSHPFVFVRAVTLVFLVQCLYGAYTPMQMEKLFWLVLGLTVAVRHLAKSETDRAVEHDPARPYTTRPAGTRGPGGGGTPVSRQPAAQTARPHRVVPTRATERSDRDSGEG